MQGVDTGQGASLVEAAIAGDAGAVRTLWEQNRRWVAAVILANKPAAADVDDLLQDVAASLVAKISTLTDPASFTPWLRTVATNAARLAGRRQNVAQGGLRIVRERTQIEGKTMAPDAAIAPARSDEAANLLRLAMDLAPEYREPLLLRALQDLSYRQISQILELPETTVETRIARARRMLRERVGATLSVTAGSPSRIS